MARTTRTKGRTPARGRRRFFDYPRSRVKGFRRWLPSWRVVVGTMLTGVALVAGVVVAAWFTTEVPDELPSVSSQTSTVYWGDGTTEMGTYAAQDREIVEYDTLPDHVGDAVVASEDRTFWNNSGVDIKGIGRALLNNLTGGGRQGASTLTQQYVERYYTDTVTDYAGKAREAILALKITQQQEKSEILGNYLNTIYFGRGAYGIQAASQKYYGVPASELTLSQSAMIAGVIPSPTNWDPANNHEQAVYRWDRTLDLMLEDGHITAADHKAAIDAGFPEPIEYVRSEMYAGPKGYLLRLVEEELERNSISMDALQSKGYKVTTTIDPAMQQAAVETAQSIPRTTEQDANPASENLRVGMVSIDPADGSIRALYGGPDAVQQAYNNVTLGAAQGGSTFKPFTLVAALEDGHTLDERYDGSSPRVFEGANDGADWPVQNFGAGNGVDWGNIDLVEATANSVNTVYAELNIATGPEKTAEVAHRAGVEDDTNIPVQPSNVLGTATLTPLELANAYTTFAAQGLRSTPHIVATVTDARGNLVYQAPGADNRERAFEPDVMAAATYAMTQVVEDGSGEPAKALERPVAGKTGTSNDNKSAWFAGYTPQLATVVTLYQSGPNGEEESITPFGRWARERNPAITGGTWPVEAWTSYMQVATANMPVEEFPAYTPPKKPKPTQTPTETPTQTETEEPEDEPTVEQPENVTVPNVVGMEQGAARAALEAEGLKVRITEEFSEQQPRGFVLSQSSLSEVPPGSTISIVVSKGPDPATQPPPETPDPEPTDTPTDGETEPPPGTGGTGGGAGGGSGGSGGSGNGGGNNGGR